MAHVFFEELPYLSWYISTEDLVLEVAGCCRRMKYGETPKMYVGPIQLLVDAEAAEEQAVTPEMEDSVSLWHRSQRVPDMHGPSNPLAAVSESRHPEWGTEESLQRWEDQSKFGVTLIPMPTLVVWDQR